MELLRRTLHIRAGESALAFRLVAIMLVAWFGAAVGASGVESLLFARTGPQVLPTLYLLLGATMIPAMLGFTALLSRAYSGRKLTQAPLFMAGFLVVARILLEQGLPSFFSALWLGMMLLWTGQIIVLWGFAGEVHDSRQAKRLFPLYGAGMIVGNAFGGIATGPLASWIGTENLIIVWASALVPVAYWAQGVIRRSGVRPREGSGSSAGLRRSISEVAQSPLLRTMATAMVALAALYFMLTLPFAEAATERFPREEQLAGFLGAFFGTVNAVSLLVSLLITNRLLARFGGPAMVAALPFIYVIGFGTLSVYQAFLPIVLFRFVQMVWVSGVWTPAWEGLFNVVSADRRSAARSLINGVPYHLGAVVAGSVLLLLRPLGPGAMFPAAAGLAAFALLVTLGVRRGYRMSLMQALREGWPEVFVASEAPFSGLRFDATALQVLKEGLTDPDPKVRRVSLEISGHLPPGEIASVVKPEQLDRSIRDPDPEIRVCALDVLGALGTPTKDLLVPLLQDPDPRMRGRAAGIISREGGDGTDVLRAMVSDPREEWRAEGVRGMAAGRGFRGLEEIVPHLSDPSDLVRESVAESLGEAQDPRAVQALIEALGDDNPAVREAAATSLVALDTDPSEQLIEALENPALEEGALLAMGKLESPPVSLQEYGARQVEVAGYLAKLQARLPETSDARIRLLDASLQHRARTHATRALKALAPFHGLDATAALESLESGGSEDVANALEALDSTRDARLRALTPIWEALDGVPEQPVMVIRELLANRDPWLRAVAAFAAASLPGTEIRASINTVGETDQDRLVTEAASWAAGGGDMKTVPTVPTLERVIFLRGVTLFEKLAPDDLQHVARAAHEHFYEDDEVIAEQGELANELHIVVEGEIRILVEGSGEVTRRGAGEHVGEMGIIGEEVRMASLVASGRVRTLSIGRQRFHRILLERPATSLAVMRSLSARLREYHQAEESLA